MATYCSRCSTANRDGSRFCNNCGAALDQPAERSCPHCQAPVLSQSAFCHVCGGRLPELEHPPVTAPEPITEMDAGADAVEEDSEVISLSDVPPTEAPPLAAQATAEPTLAPAIDALPAEPVVEADAATEAAAVDVDAGAELAPATATIDVEEAAPVRPASGAARQAVSLVRVRPSPGTPAPAVAAAPRRSVTPDGWRRLAYAALAAAVIIGLFLPAGTLGKSTPPSASVRALYSAIDALPPRANVLVAFDYEAATRDEMRPLAQAIVSHLMQKKARLFSVSLLAQGPALADEVLRPLAEKNIYSYGVDYVNLGFLPGDDAALAALNGDVRSLFMSDFVYAQPLSAFTIGSAITTAASADLIIEISDDENGVQRWVEQVQQRSNVPLAAATSAAAVPLAYPYLQSGQVVGLAGGLPAAAEYESLLGQDGPATRGMDAQSLGHLVILALIVLGNLSLLTTRRRPVAA